MTKCLVNSLSQGIYLCKGPHSTMWWFLNKTDYKISVQSGNTEELQLLSFGSSIFSDEMEILVFFPKSTKLKIPNVIPEGKIILVMLSSYTGELEGSYEGIYKKYSNGNVKQIDFGEFDSWKNLELKEHPESLPLIKTVNNLLMYYFAKDNEEIYSQHQRSTTTKTKELLKLLGTKESIKIYGSLSREDMYSIFLTPDKTLSSFYKLLVTGYKIGRYREFGLCSSLWIYWDMFCNAHQERHRFNPELFLSKFATWVYYTNTLWNTPECKGLFLYKSIKGNETWVFNPSTKAFNNLTI